MVIVDAARGSTLNVLKIRHKNYAAVATSTFIGDRLVETGVDFIDEEGFTYDPSSVWLEKYFPDRRHITNENTYLIYSEDAMNPPDGDIRCH